MLRNALCRLAKPADKSPDRVRRLPDLRPQNIKRPDVRDRRARDGAAEDSKRPRRPRKVPRRARVKPPRLVEEVDGRELPLAHRAAERCAGSLCDASAGAIAAGSLVRRATFVANATATKSSSTNVAPGGASASARVRSPATRDSVSSWTRTSRRRTRPRRASSSATACESVAANAPAAWSARAAAPVSNAPTVSRRAVSSARQSAAPVSFRTARAASCARSGGKSGAMAQARRGRAQQSAPGWWCRQRLQRRQTRPTASAPSVVGNCIVPRNKVGPSSPWRVATAAMRGMNVGASISHTSSGRRQGQGSSSRPPGETRAGPGQAAGQGAPVDPAGAR